MATSIEQKKIFRILEFNKGQVIFKEGQTAAHAFLIRAGKVALYQDVDGHRVFVAFMVPGQILGEMAIITGEPRSATAEAAEYSELLVMDQKTLQNALNGILPIIKALLNQLITRIKRTDKKNPPRAGAVTKNQRRIDELERTIRTIHGEARDWLLAHPEMDPNSRQCLDMISRTCEKTLQP
ncbi:MAG: cyclic nucleotide-binding domain-containing protein [Thermodesulfobacteriota bacterium]